MSTDKEIMQEMFDKVYAHMVKQGVAAKNDDGDCVYRTSTGQMCAVGCLIDWDRKDADEIEETVAPVEDLLLIFGREVILGAGELGKGGYAYLREMLEDLQTIHDASYNWGWYRFNGHEEMGELATAYKLKFKPLTGDKT